MRQWRILADMAEQAPKTPTDLARLGEVDKGLLSRNLKVLIGLGLVSAERSGADRRQQLISLTERGRALYREVSPVMQARNRMLTETVGDVDLEVFFSVLERLGAVALSEEGSRRASDPGGL